jgi:hypothetical protein
MGEKAEAFKARLNQERKIEARDEEMYHYVE